VTDEIARIDVVIAKYRMYRNNSGLIGIVALIGLVFPRAGWIKGVATGLLLLISLQLVVDHYSEARARDYRNRLSQLCALQKCRGAFQPPLDPNPTIGAKRADHGRAAS
jgi:hypothetical protein